MSTIISEVTTKEHKLNKKNLQEKVRPSGLVEQWLLPGACQTLREIEERLEREGFFKNV